MPAPAGVLDTKPSAVPRDLAGSVLEGLSLASQERLLARSTYIEVPAGTRMIRPAGGWERAGIILEGLARFFIASDDARQITVRYVRPGGILGNILPVSGDRATVGVTAITDCRILEIEVDQLLEMIKADGDIAVVVLEILHRRLENLYAVVASSAFGTVRERIAGQLLDLAGPDTSGAIAVEITQQELADSVGTVREVAARALRELRRDGLVTTDDGRIVVVDPAGLAATVGRWHPGGKRAASRLTELPVD